MVQAFLLVVCLALFAALPIIVSGLPTTPQTVSSGTTYLVLDVDAGADDAIAILLALGEEKRNPNLKVVAITCVHGNTALDNVVNNVLKTLKTAGRLDIPVYRGASKSLRITPPGDEYFGKDGFGDFEYPDAPKVEDYLQKDHAVDALVRLSKEYKGKLTVLALGSLTNLGLAIRMAPDFLKNVNVAILGGSTEGVGNIKPGVEFNFFMDPEANFIVFNSTTKETNPITLIPWETCKERNKITVRWRKNELGTINSEKINLINKAEGKILTNEPDNAQWVSADPMAAAVVVNPSLVTSNITHNVAAETEGDYGRGAIFVDYNDVRPVKNTVIIKNIDVEAYKTWLKENLSS
ncbi:inosine-uridine preferring nucleoside hydrolase [Anabrus simplex]|uniref:inosine-uridine preferring nucleoside hydrolase n=1 Tax=Anabrus simplex TaxID=316456 RepID=UPI0034DDA8C2